MNRDERLAAAALPPAVLLAFGLSLANGFALDDFFVILGHASGLPRVVWRPLQDALFALNGMLTGYAPIGFHAVDLALHALNSWLLFAYLSRRFGSGPGPWVGALLFALHPAQAQSVAYASARCGPLSFAFGMLSLLQPRRSVAWFTLALLSKESAIAFLPLLAADRRLFGGEFRLLPHLGAAAAYFAARFAVLGALSQRGPWDASWPAHALVAGRALLQNLGIASLLVELREPHGFAKGPWYPAAAAAGWAAFSALGATGLWGLWKRRAWALGPFWFWTALLPVSQIIPFNALAADRFLYAPLAGAGVLAAYMLKSARWRPVPSAAAAAVAVLLTLSCASAVLPWRGPLPLALHAYQVSNAEAYAGLRLALLYQEANMFSRAESLINAALGDEQLADVRRLGHKRLAQLRARRDGRRRPLS